MGEKKEKKNKKKKELDPIKSDREKFPHFLRVGVFQRLGYFLS